LSQPKQFIIAATSDLFIQSRLGELAGQLGHVIVFQTDSEEIIGQASSHHGCLVILDLTATEYDSDVLARKLKQASPSTRIVGYYPHVRTDLQKNAKDAGVDYIVPNSSFLKTTREILERGGKA